MIDSFSDELLKLAANETWENLKYILGHKYHLYKGGREIDLDRLLLLGHDLSKFRPSEFMAYKKFFFGNPTEADKKKFRKIVRESHYKRNPHHRQHWKGKMPMKHKLEMVVDWYSAGRTQGTHRFKSFKSWYRKNRASLPISDATRREIDRRL